jgi:mannose PTS system EIIA component
MWRSEAVEQMIGIVIAAHQDLGPALLRAAEGILGRLQGITAISLNYDEDPIAARRRIEEAIKKSDAGEGVLVLTDMFGGTPTNMSLPFLEPGKVEVLTGVNLPMVLKAESGRGEMALQELACTLKEYGGKNIVLASEIWNARPGTTA